MTIETSAPLPLSVSIISFNEEENIARTLEAIKPLAAQIVIVDSHSKDKTVEIAKSYGAEVYDEDWKGHIDQKNSALEKCTQPWILALDCDEVVTPELAAEIRKAVESGDAAGYELDRQTVYLGKKMEHMWQPDWKLRLIRKDASPKWGGYNPHDALRIVGRTKKLAGKLEHYSYKDMNDHWQRTLSYAKTVAESYDKAGKKFRWYKLILSPIAGTFRNYILKGGFLDGSHGFFAAMSKFVYTYWKYMFLWEIQKNRKDRDRADG